MSSYKEVPAFVCSHVFFDTKPILLVCKEENEIQFLCGDDHDIDEIPRVVGLNHLLDRDSTLQKVIDIPNGYEAERNSKESDWVISQIKD